MSQENVFNLESDNDSNSSSNDSQPRTTRHSLGRYAKKSTSSPQEVVVPKQPVITRRQVALANREKQKFLGSFNPETSDREKRKIDKKIQNSKKTQGLINDSRGFNISSGQSLCDCFETYCPGCFYPCKKCNSTKCGIECRVNRKTKYESLEYHGYNITKRFPF